MRFNSYNAYPPGGMYFFELNGEYVQSQSKPDICQRVKRLYERAGLPVPFDPFEVVMSHMCPTMPPGMCNGETAPGVSVSQVKENTRKLFGQKPAQPVVIRERLHVCLGCKENSKSSCPSCSGLLDWVLDGVGSRTRIPADNFAYVCRPAAVFVSAVVSVESPGPVPEGCPENCWRRNGN